jgi:hypothetical protein
MKAHRGLILAAALLAAGGCQQAPQVAWFEGGFDAARVEAESRDTLIMLDFYSHT